MAAKRTTNRSHGAIPSGAAISTKSQITSASLGPDPLLTDFDLERLTGRARSSWQKDRLTGDSPPSFGWAA